MGKGWKEKQSNVTSESFMLTQNECNMIVYPPSESTSKPAVGAERQMNNHRHHTDRKHHVSADDVGLLMRRKLSLVS